MASKNANSNAAPAAKIERVDSGRVEVAQEVQPRRQAERVVDVTAQIVVVNPRLLGAEIDAPESVEAPGVQLAPIAGFDADRRQQPQLVGGRQRLPRAVGNRARRTSVPMPKMKWPCSRRCADRARCRSAARSRVMVWPTVRLRSSANASRCASSPNSSSSARSTFSSRSPVVAEHRPAALQLIELDDQALLATLGHGDEAVLVRHLVLQHPFEIERRIDLVRRRRGDAGRRITVGRRRQGRRRRRRGGRGLSGSPSARPAPRRARGAPIPRLLLHADTDLGGRGGGVAPNQDRERQRIRASSTSCELLACAGSPLRNDAQRLAVRILQGVCQTKSRDWAEPARRDCQKANGTRRWFTHLCPSDVTAVAAIRPSDRSRPGVGSRPKTAPRRPAPAVSAVCAQRWAASQDHRRKSSRNEPGRTTPAIMDDGQDQEGQDGG